MSSYGIFENKNKTKKLVYYPCPKNANSSAKLFFAKHLNIAKNFIFLGDEVPRFLQKKEDYQNKKNLVSFLPTKQPFAKINSDYKCCITRDPIKRFISTYKNRILYHKDQDFNNHSIDLILEKLENNLFENKHFLPQTYFLGNDLNYYNFYADVNNINVFEKKVNDFFNNNIKFPKIQTGGSDINVVLNSEQITKIKIIYKADFNFLKLNNK
tara:strand:- start:102 stop:737 length:636 start_codon:yes stop_codon:yes gene_type:complete